ncbi:hypothetical protein [uncultured Pontibacter sp.]|uniref:hypothetical protein n=1 Tax=uncultured Pontibacter sp. TaxID=453356 RepID=UPI0026042005|nr:hypothetical protein [uncultured Pontibacter sp.]
MAYTFRDIWVAINKLLTLINAILFSMLGGSLYNHKKKRYVKIPLVANIALLLVLGTTVGAYIYKLFIVG